MKIKPDGWREFAERYALAWCSKDPARVAEHFSPEGSLRVNGAAPAVGRKAIREIAQGFMTDFPDMQVSMDNLVIQESGAIFHWTLSGTYSGTGKRVRISGYEEWTLGDDGLIARSLGHFDESLYQHQLQHGFECRSD